ncbi:hypothetical protein ILUMI_07737 [Ignelater luminosus]|uniref:Uncharacterized protein n=1 Tax=Ignelater luminosus TaxID=2038154 RepID=A0A8K0GHQ8_IGNLU|nr:hypothetical protein ILUMI_07737 [Ignelater luminosus]
MEELDANDDPYSFDGYDSDVDKEYLPSDLEERHTNQIVSISTSSGDTQEETVEESVSRQAEVNLNERANTKKGVVGPVNRSRKRKRDSNTWACNVRKKTQQWRRIHIFQKKVSTSKENRKFKRLCKKMPLQCSQKISDTQRKEIYREYYALSTEAKIASLKGKEKTRIMKIQEGNHYCRARTQREYMESTLNIKKMYELYVKFATEKQFKPKKDGCDVCVLNKLCTEEERLTDEDKNHILEKNAAREERQKDREGKAAVLTFDLQNVLTCQKAEISKFFYKSKLSVYNLTAHLSIIKQVYCALWSEHLTGRKGNRLTSALYKILKNVIEDHPNLEEIILCSDSCVSHNRNSIMSFAVQSFLKLHPNLRKIAMTYSTPGHSCEQEVNSVYSSIERVLCKAEYYSPLSLIRLLLKVNRRLPYKIIQMRAEYFKDFYSLDSTFNYNNVPFSKIVFLECTQSSYNVSYKTSFIQEEFLSANLRTHQSRANAEHDIFLTCPAISKETNNNLPSNKVSTLQFMLKWMPKNDQDYYNTLLPKTNNTSTKGKKKSNQEASRDVRVHSQAFKYQSNEYREFPVVYDANQCDLEEKDTFGTSISHFDTNLRSCPIKKIMEYTSKRGISISKEDESHPNQKSVTFPQE